MITQEIFERDFKTRVQLFNSVVREIMLYETENRWWEKHRQLEKLLQKLFTHKKNILNDGIGIPT